MIFPTARAFLLATNKATTQQQTSIRQFASAEVKRRKRGSRQKERNIKSYEAVKNEESVSGVPQAFFILGVFPFVAMGGVLFIRDDLRQDFKDRYGLN
jgi:hypothetical protein